MLFNQFSYSSASNMPPSTSVSGRRIINSSPPSRPIIVDIPQVLDTDGDQPRHNFISNDVPISIIHFLKIIKINPYQNKWVLEPYGAVQLPLPQLDDPAPVIDSRQLISDCQMLHLIVQAGIFQSQRRLICKTLQPLCMDFCEISKLMTVNVNEAQCSTFTLIGH